MAGERILHVLLVDSDRERRASAAAVLRAQNCRVDEHDGADAALAAAREDPPEVVVTDDPVLIDAIKRDLDLFAIAVVLRARRLDVDDALDGMARGAHGVLVDPVADAELVTSVRSAARTSDLQAELLSRHETLERMAFTDDLSDLPNRRFLDRQLQALISAARRHGRPLSVASVDIDRFKPINDTHGHAVGDAVIAAVAARMRERLRGEDHLGRFGGEEFLALLPDTDGEAAELVAEDLRSAVADGPIATDAGPLTVTVSVGWAQWDDDEPAHRLLARADEALYAAKERGRDRVVGELELRASRR
jgi:diguanylate cyclase (GGDEF)-like protein